MGGRGGWGWTVMNGMKTFISGGFLSLLAWMFGWMEWAGGYFSRRIKTEVLPNLSLSLPVADMHV